MKWSKGQNWDSGHKESEIQRKTCLFSASYNKVPSVTGHLHFLEVLGEENPYTFQDITVYVKL